MKQRLGLFIVLKFVYLPAHPNRLYANRKIISFCGLSRSTHFSWSTSGYHLRLNLCKSLWLCGWNTRLVINRHWYRISAMIPLLHTASIGGFISSTHKVHETRIQSIKGKKIIMTIMICVQVELILQKKKTVAAEMQMITA